MIFNCWFGENIGSTDSAPYWTICSLWWLYLKESRLATTRDLQFDTTVLPFAGDNVSFGTLARAALCEKFALWYCVSTLWGMWCLARTLGPVPRYAEVFRFDTTFFVAQEKDVQFDTLAFFSAWRRFSDWYHASASANIRYAVWYRVFSVSWKRFADWYWSLQYQSANLSPGPQISRYQTVNHMSPASTLGITP